MRITISLLILYGLCLTACSPGRKAFETWKALERVEFSEFRAPSAEAGVLMASDSGGYFNLTLPELRYTLPAKNNFMLKEGTLYVPRTGARSRLTMGMAINPEVVLYPTIEEVRIEKVVLQSPVYGQKLVTGIIRRLVTDTLFVSTVEYAPGMAPALLSDMGPDAGRAAAELQQELERVIAQFPAHAAFLAQADIQRLVDSLGRFKAKTLRLDFASLRACVPEYMNIMDWTRSTINQLKEKPKNTQIRFNTGEYIREESTGWEFLQAILDSTKQELLTGFPATVPHKLIFRLSGYADEQEIDGSLKAELDGSEKNPCPSGPDKQSCLNLRLSRKRSAVVESFCRAYFKAINWSALQVKLDLDAKGYGWELPGDYDGRCPEKDCPDRRVTIVSVLILPDLGPAVGKPDQR